MEGKLKVCVSGYKDYVSVYKSFEDKSPDEDILKISNGEILELHSKRESWDVPDFQNHYEDFYDVFLLAMDKGILYTMMASQTETSSPPIFIPCGNSWSICNPNDLLDWNFKKIVPHRADVSHYKNLNTNWFQIPKQAITG